MTGRRSLRGEAGLGTVETVLVVPVLLLAIVALVQGAVFLHARQVVEAAARDGASAARAADGSAEVGRDVALDTLRQLAPRALRKPSVSVTRDSEMARSEVRAWAPGPLFDIALQAVSSGAVERFRPEGQP